MGNDDTGLSAAEMRDLSDIAGTMIPESVELGMPGADDPAILDDIARSVGRDLPMVRQAVAEITARSGGAFAGLDRDRREALINDYARSGGAAAAVLGRVVVGAYYRDDRVLLALGQEARAPFPKGYTLEQGDWSLLDAVRHRPPLWRDDRTTAGGKR
jgi:hypothetical protein